MKVDRKTVYTAILLAIVIWVIDATTDSLYFSRGPFLDSLILDLPTHEIYGRLTSFVIVLISGFILSRLIAKQKAAEYELAKANQELETKVAQRTEMLRCTNENLRAQVDEHRRTTEALQNSERRLRNVSLQLLAAQERERKEISRELHDEFGQTLALLKQTLWRAEKKAEEKESELVNNINESLQKVDEIIENVRRISRDLSPPVLEYGGLSIALRKLIDDFCKHCNIRVTAELDTVDHAIPKEFHIVVYRIFQEALNNISKHASASHLSVYLKKNDHDISVLIEDNGVGFNVDHTILRNAEGKGFGLAILNKRVSMLGGQLAVWSQEGKGTRMSFSIPASTMSKD